MVSGIVCAMDAAPLAALVVVAFLGVALGAAVAAAWFLSRRSGTGDEALASALIARAEDQTRLSEGMARLDASVREIADHRVSWQSQLRAQVEEVRHSTESLRRETGALATALRRPQVRGRWGELHLRRTVEAAGMSAHCDFDEQASFAGEDGTLRPDLVVHLAGGKQVVVDSKVPLDAFLDAGESDDPEETAAHLRRHARQLRTHADQLSSKGYWRALPHTPEFVVLFVPGESFLAAALEDDPSLLEHAAARKVVLATPTTLIALLRTVAHAWTTETLAEQAHEVQRLGRELHERLATTAGHLDRLGRSLGSAVAAYNAHVGALESRVLVTARRFSELGAVSGDAELAAPQVVEAAPRPLAAQELAVAAPTQSDGEAIDDLTRRSGSGPVRRVERETGLDGSTVSA